MIYDAIVNGMTADELRNYLFHCEALQEQQTKYCNTLEGLLETYERLNLKLSDMFTYRERYLSELRFVRKMEKELETKYDNLLQRPCEGVTTTKEEDK